VRIDAGLAINAATRIVHSLLRVSATTRTAVFIISHLLCAGVIATRITISATVRVIRLLHFSSVAAVHVSVAAVRILHSLRRACANAAFGATASVGCSFHHVRIACAPPLCKTLLMSQSELLIASIFFETAERLAAGVSSLHSIPNSLWALSPPNQLACSWTP
jgi:hypothetical protein